MGRVFHVLTEAEPFSENSGGAISRWAANVTRLDSSAVICAPWFDESWGFDAARLHRIPRLATYKTANDLVASRIPWPLRRALLLVLFDELLDEIRPGDTVWIHNRPEFAAALSGQIRDRGGRSVLHMHNAHLAQWLLRGHPMPGTDLYVFVSKFLLNEATTCGAVMRHSDVLYNGADETIFYPTNENATTRRVPTVLFAGRLVPEKGVHIFLEAMYGLWRQEVPLNGVVIGGVGFGDQRPSEYVKRLKTMSPANVSFEDYCSGSKLGDRFRDADIFCQPSCWHDPFPLAVLEAMACRLPVVTTRSGGIPEALAAGGGVMVTRDDVPELQTALMRFALDAEEREKTGELGYESFRRNFTWQCVREHYREILMKVWAKNALAAFEESNLESEEAAHLQGDTWT
jgi:spore coat protein SA